MGAESPEDTIAKSDNAAAQDAQSIPAEIECGCESHPKHKITVIEAPLDVNSFFNGIFMSQNNALVRLAHRRRDTEDIIVDPWECDAKNELGARELRYTVKYKTPLSLFSQSSRAIEKQTILRKDLGKAFVVSTVVSTPDVPGGESFTSIMRYCFTAADGGKSVLRATAEVQFSRKLMFGKKIESMSVEGSRLFMSCIHCILKEYEFNLDELFLVEETKSEELNLRRKVFRLEDSMRRATVKYDTELTVGGPMQEQLPVTPQGSQTSYAGLSPDGRPHHNTVSSIIRRVLDPQLVILILTILCTVSAIHNFFVSFKISRSFNSINPPAHHHPHSKGGSSPLQAFFGGGEDAAVSGSRPP